MHWAAAVQSFLHKVLYSDLLAYVSVIYSKAFCDSFSIQELLLNIFCQDVSLVEKSQFSITQYLHKENVLLMLAYEQVQMFPFTSYTHAHWTGTHLVVQQTIQFFFNFFWHQSGLSFVNKIGSLSFQRAMIKLTNPAVTDLRLLPLFS